MSRRDDEELMAFLDGELPPRDAREVEARIGASAETRQKVEALTELSTLVRSHYELATDEAEPGMAATWARLEAQLGNAPPAPVTARAEAARVGEPVGFWQAIVDALVPRWTHAAVGAIGVAAGVLLAIGLRPTHIQVVSVHEPVVVPVVERVEPPPVVAVVADEGAADDLEVPNGTGMVFQVASNNSEAPTTVIWVTEEEATEGPI